MSLTNRILGREYMKIAICDDSKKDRENLFMKLHECFSLRQIKMQIDIYENAEQLIKNKDKLYDIYFLDIYMGEIDGIQLAKQINRLHKRALIILTTTSRQHYAEGFEVGAVHYLVKPYTNEDLEIAITRCLKIIKIEEPYIEIMVERENKKVLYAWITYIESQNRYCIIQTMKQQFKTYQQLSELEGLLDDARFLRCHRSYIVNLDYVADYQNGVFLMKNGIEIPIKRGDRKNMKQQYEDYFFEKMRLQFGKEHLL